MKEYVVLVTPYGSVGIVGAEHGISNIILTRRTVRQTELLLAGLHPDAHNNPNLHKGLQSQLRDYFAGVPVRFRVHVDFADMSSFQREVLQACAKLGYGETTAYGDLARQIGRPKAARAVGTALARNPVPIVIPCHRVIARDGSLCGFSAEQGVDLKRQLLEMEAKGVAQTKGRRRS